MMNWKTDKRSRVCRGSIHPSNFKCFSLTESQGYWSQAQLPSGDRWSIPWTSRQLTAGLIYTDKQPLRLTLMPKVSWVIISLQVWKESGELGDHVNSSIVGQLKITWKYRKLLCDQSKVCWAKIWECIIVEIGCSYKCKNKFRWIEMPWYRHEQSRGNKAEAAGGVKGSGWMRDRSIVTSWINPIFDRIKQSKNNIKGSLTIILWGPQHWIHLCLAKY